MHFDWTVSIGSLLTMAGFVMSIIVSYYTMQRDIDRRFYALSSTVDGQFAKLDQRLATIFEGDVRELRGRTEKLEVAQADLLTNMVERSHKLGGELQTLVLKVDRLERPHGPILKAKAP